MKTLTTAEGRELLAQLARKSRWSAAVPNALAGLPASSEEIHARPVMISEELAALIVAELVKVVPTVNS